MSRSLKDDFYQIFVFMEFILYMGKCIGKWTVRASVQNSRIKCII